MAARTARGFKKLVRTWLIKIVEGRYRCWDDFLYYGMASAGHSDPPGAPMKLLSVGDGVYAFLNTWVTSAAGRSPKPHLLPINLWSMAISLQLTGPEVSTR